jgi:SAM-dependent methyltransferase
VRPGPPPIEPPRSRRADDDWLERWLPLLREHARERCVLELGCGKGRDTAMLLAAGLRVVAIDRSIAALAEARRALPGATFIESDLRSQLPIDPADVGAIVASLSLHYFDWPTTCAIVGRMQACLAPSGLLICRVNSSRDFHHGAIGHPPIEPGYFRVGEEPSEDRPWPPSWSASSSTAVSAV